MSEVGSRKSEVRSQKSEVRRRTSDSRLIIKNVRQEPVFQRNMFNKGRIPANFKQISGMTVDPGII